MYAVVGRAHGLFPNPAGTAALSVCSAQRAYHAACDGAGITKPGGIHLLRHCFATHLRI